MDMSCDDSDGPKKQQDDDKITDDEPKRPKEKKGLISQGAGYGTIYKTTSSKDANHLKSTKFKQFNFEKRQHTKLTCPLSHFDGFNLWLLKPTHMNRGRGIHVFNDLPTLHKLIKEYCLGKEEESLKKKSKNEKGEK
jgi:hypothetical protein